MAAATTTAPMISVLVFMNGLLFWFDYLVIIVPLRAAFPGG
jgi:hypothetical protein